MSATKSGPQFFREKKAAAVLKHGVLRYVRPWAMKVGYTSEGGRVVVLDGYAGAGEYEDGTQGSPLIMADQLRDLKGRSVDLVLVESDKETFQTLVSVLDREGYHFNLGPINGALGDSLPDILSFAGSAPLFAFLDPFGLTLSFDEVVGIMNRSPHAKTEILLNFSADGVRRIGGLLDKETGAGRDRTLERLDNVCGGDWWRDVYRSHMTAGGVNADGVAEDVSEAVALEYMKRLCVAAGRAGGAVAPVRKAAHHKPAYCLVFLTRHQDGMILFCEALSKAQEAWRSAVAPDDLFGQPEYREAEEKELAASWVDAIDANIRALLGRTETVSLGISWTEIFGEVLGEAREMHLRAALKQLKAAGAIKEVPTGTLSKKSITRA